MKAWRLHNMQQTATLQYLQKMHAMYGFWPEEQEKIAMKIKQVKGFYLRTKTERRGQFAAEVASPSQLLWKLFKHAGYQVPEALQ